MHQYQGEDSDDLEPRHDPQVVRDPRPLRPRDLAEQFRFRPASESRCVGRGGAERHFYRCSIIRRCRGGVDDDVPPKPLEGHYP